LDKITYVDNYQWIYNPLPLTTRAPTPWTKL